MRKQEVTMKAAAIAGALAFSFVLGGISTLLGFPRHSPAGQQTSTISPEDLTRNAGPMTVTVVDNYQ
jgi:hypothetical protein